MGKNRREFVETALYSGALLGASRLFSGCRNLDGSAVQQTSGGGSYIETKGAARIRKSIASLTTAEVQAYATAIEKMKALPETDGRSLKAQAKIHGDHCSHGTWLFIPWHRPYLAYFEDICRELLSDDNFALPYWDWSAPGGNSIPKAFADSSSPLYDSTRTLSGSLEASQVGLPNIDTQLTGGLWETIIGDENMSGIPEGSPHGYVHVLVGGNMGGFDTAGLDPLFWTHHCNIDRFFESWMVGMKINSHPVSALDKKWKEATLGTFYDRKGNEVSPIKLADTLDSTRGGFQYDKLISIDSSKIAPVTSIHAVPANRKLSSKVKGGLVAFALDPSSAAAVTAFANSSNDLALTGSIQTPSWTLNALAIAVKGTFNNKDVLSVSIGSQKIAEFYVFSHHSDGFHVDISRWADKLNPSKIELQVALNKRPLTSGDVELVLA